jgi:putative ABC transport system substrate-binding protein
MKRRAFIELIGGAAACLALILPQFARAQAIRIIGFLNNSTQQSQAHFAEAFREGLRKSGFTEGQNVALEYRWAEGKYDLLPDFAAELVHRRVALIAATGGTVSAVAAHNATKDIPIVFVMGADPLKAGLVESLNRPGTNVTGVTTLSVALTAKRIQLIRQLAPKTKKVAVLVNPNSPDAQALSDNAEQAAREIGEQINIIKAGTEQEINLATETLAREPDTGLVVTNDAFFTSQAQQIAAAAARFKLPTMYPYGVFATSGGLMSYGTKLTDAFENAGSYAAQILKGARPADLPVIQPTKFEFTINLKTAKALGLTVPANVLALADEVIE